MDIKASIAITTLLAAAVLLAACGTSTPQPTLTPLPSPTLTVTATMTASPTPSPMPTATAMHTPEPTATQAPSATPGTAALPMPEGEPAAEWQGVPVMPGAVAGEDKGGSYLFTIKASAKEIQAYYEKELRKLGWSLLGVGEGKTANVLLIFQKDGGTLSFAIIDPGAGDGVMQVLVVK